MTQHVSIHQAAFNALAAWLVASLQNSPTVEPRWPDLSKIFNGGTGVERPTAVTIIGAGKRQDEYVDAQTTSVVDNGNGTLTTRRAAAHVIQPFQIDVWAAYDDDRDDLVAQLDQLFAGQGGSLTDPIVAAMRAGRGWNGNAASADATSNFGFGEAHGVALTLGDGFGSPPTDPVVADFSFDGVDINDTADNVGRSTYRATYSGEARMLLTVTSTDAKLARLTLRSLLHDGLVAAGEKTLVVTQNDTSTTYTES